MLSRTSRLWNQKNTIIKQQKREILPLIGVGLGILAVGTAAQYVIRTLRRMEEEKRKNNGGGGDGDGGDGKGDGNGEKGNDSSDNHSKHHHQQQQHQRQQHVFPKKSLGIDIGTTYSRLSYRDSNTIEIIENKEGFRATPVALFKTKEETSVGSFAARQRWANPSKVGVGYHALIGSTPKDPNVKEYLSKVNAIGRIDESHQDEVAIFIGGTSISASSLYTYVAKDLLQTIQNKFENISSIPATISVPNYYNINQIKSTLNAVQQSGFSCQQYIPDSVAALVGVHNRGYLPQSDTTLIGKYLVLDIGGRITQMSVVSMTEQSYEVLGHKTLFNVGGEYINDELANYIASDYLSKNQIQLLNDSFSKQRIYDAVESVKIDLSKTLSSKIDLPYITADMNGPKHLQMDISRAKLDHLMTPMFHQIKAPLTQLLTEIKLQNLNEINSFVVVGGGARIPLVQKISKEMLGIEPVFPTQPEEIISIGASVYSSKYLK